MISRGALSEGTVWNFTETQVSNYDTRKLQDKQGAMSGEKDATQLIFQAKAYPRRRKSPEWSPYMNRFAWKEQSRRKRRTMSTRNQQPNLDSALTDEGDFSAIAG